MVDARGKPLQTIFDKWIVGEKDTWVTWNGKNDHGQEVPVGQYFVIFYKGGKPLRSVSVFYSGRGTNP
jgi:flagellar hook assembly protein FlgD